jgi:hypothetical protein
MAKELELPGGRTVVFGSIRHPPPDELAELCHAVMERVCDAIENGRPIGFDCTQVFSNHMDRRNALSARIRALRDRLGAEKDEAPFPPQSIFRLYNAVLQKMPDEVWRTIDVDDGVTR